MIYHTIYTHTHTHNTFYIIFRIVVDVYWTHTHTHVCTLMAHLTQVYSDSNHVLTLTVAITHR